MLFANDREADAVIARVVDVSGLSKNFEIRAAGVPNAVAMIQGDARYILYNQYFITQTDKSTHTKWGAISILAHEVGHHLNGHTLKPGGSRPDLEIQADYFSGFVLQKMGASLEEARIAMETLASDQASPTHPAKNDRLAAITNGWKKSQSMQPTPAPEPTTPPPVPKVTPRTRPAPSPDPDPDPEPTPRPRRTRRTGSPSGTPLGQCGCWGPDTGQPRPDSRCESGYAVPQLCPGFCPLGGSPWRGVCQ